MNFAWTLLLAAATSSHLAAAQIAAGAGGADPNAAAEASSASAAAAAASPVLADPLQLEGTWSSKSNAVFTGPVSGFFLVFGAFELGWLGGGGRYFTKGAQNKQ